MALNITKLFLLVHTVISALLSLIGLVSFGLLARWYTGRVRDDVTTHMWVEEVYDRYLPERPDVN